MTLPEFHLRLFGKDSKSYRLTRGHKELYDAFEEGKRGVQFRQVGEQSLRTFLPVFVLALYQTQVPQLGEVHLVLPPSLSTWGTTHMRDIVSCLIKERVARGSTRKDLHPLTESISKVVLISSPFIFNKAPERWASYGLTEVPEWAEEGQLLLT